MESVLKTAGVTIFVVLVVSAGVLPYSHYHTMQRDASIAVFNVSAWFELLWAVCAVPFVVIRWRTTAAQFKIVLVLNMLVVALLLTDFALHH